MHGTHHMGLDVTVMTEPIQTNMVFGEPGCVLFLRNRSSGGQHHRSGQATSVMRNIEVDEIEELMTVNS
jgi:hypothetical protein